MTPKRIGEVLGERLVQIGAMTPEAKRRRAVEFVALEAAIKLLTPEAEADRRLGAKVREWVGSVPLAALEQTLAEEYAGQGTGVTTRGLMKRLVDALREEAGR